MSENEIIVSFIIPSYNRAKMTLIMAESILAYSGDDIEVVVADNASEDNTLKILQNIDDKRLVIIENEKNLGGPGNMLQSMKYGKGRYLFVAFSRDNIAADKIPALIRFLRDGDHTFVYCENDSEEKKENRIWHPGKQSVKKFGYATLHPTGMIFSREKLMKIISGISPGEAKDRYLYFPHDFWLTEMIMTDDAETYGERVRGRVEDEYYKHSVSANVNLSGDVWFFPKGRMLQLEKYLNHLATLKMTDAEKGKILEWIYSRELKNCTIVYKELRSNEDNCAHYSAPPGRVSVKEMLRGATLLRESISEISRRNGFKLSPFFLPRLKMAKAESLVYIAVSGIAKAVRNIIHK